MVALINHLLTYLLTYCEFARGTIRYHSNSWASCWCDVIRSWCPPTGRCSVHRLPLAAEWVWRSWSMVHWYCSLSRCCGGHLQPIFNQWFSVVMHFMAQRNADCLLLTVNHLTTWKPGLSLDQGQGYVTSAFETECQSASRYCNKTSCCHLSYSSAAACLSPDVLCSRYAMKLRLMW